MMALAAHGAPHVEASHPREAELMHATDLRPWSAALRSPSHRIARRPERTKTDNVGLSTLCRPLFAPPVAASQRKIGRAHV